MKNNKGPKELKTTLWGLLWRNNSITCRRLPFIPLLVYTKELHAKLRQMLLIILRRHHELLMTH